MRNLLFISLLLSWIVIMSNVAPKEKPMDMAALGKRLFMDSILSEDKTLSCASCHRPEFAFADTSAVSIGVRGQKGNRNTPSAMNMSLRPVFFWDGRAATLEAQALMPIANPVEMNLPVDSAVARLRQDAYYAKTFREVFDSEPTKENLAQALAAFERTLETVSEYDKFMAGDSTAISKAAQRGMDVFNNKGKCFECHAESDLTTDEFRNIGLFDQQKYIDAGRFDFTKDISDIGKFKVPSLRNVAVTAPYMHDGSFRTLREVIDYYNVPSKFVKSPLNTDSLMVPNLQLTEQEMQDLEAFLRTLTAPQFVK